jgi:hypothetical protein
MSFALETAFDPKSKKTDPHRDLRHAIAQKISRLKLSRNRVACSSIRRSSLSGIWPCSSSQTAKAAFTSVCRRSVIACSLVSEPLASRASSRPPSTIPKAASWPLISGSLLGKRSSCFWDFGFSGFIRCLFSASLPWRVYAA